MEGMPTSSIRFTPIQLDDPLDRKPIGDVPWLHGKTDWGMTKSLALRGLDASPVLSRRCQVNAAPSGVSARKR